MHENSQAVDGGFLQFREAFSGFDGLPFDFESFDFSDGAHIIGP